MDITTLHKVDSDVTSVPTVIECTPNMIVAGAIFAEGSSMIVVQLGARSLLIINYVSMSKILVMFQSVTLVHVERCFHDCQGNRFISGRRRLCQHARDTHHCIS